MASSAPPLSLDKEQLFLDVDALKPGMKGYGKTVFSGKNIERFDIEVIGVLKNWEAKTDMILIQMSGASLDKTGIIAGMSGSPVYIDDKLIGAVSYGWTFAKDAIAGVTPIKDMLNVLHNIDVECEKPNIIAGEERLQYQDVIIQGEKERRQRGKEVKRDLFASLPPNLFAHGKLVPIKTPLVVSGFDGRVLERMGRELGKYGLLPVQGGAGNPGGTWVGGALSDSIGDFQPGAAVAAVLIQGDLNAASIGTLTYKEGNNIVAFGHPFFHTGTTDLPMSMAHVYTIIANQSTSFKVAAATDVIGRISQDRKPGIAGTIGEYARMISCEVEVNGAQSARYNFEIVHDKILSPNLARWAIESALLATEKRAGPKMVRLRLAIQLEGRHKPIEIENTYYVVSARWDPIYDITSPIGTLLNNPFKKDVKINKISLNAYVFDTRRTAYIENVKVSKRTVKPGETIQVNVTLRPFASQTVQKTVSFQIPNDIVPGSIISLTACDSQYSQSLKRLRAPDIFKPKNFDQLVDLIETTEKRTNLIVRVRLSKRGITCQGQSFPSLPSSILSIMTSSNQSGVGILCDEIVLRIETDWVLSGMQSLPLIVENG
ncbi:MAG: SpoIVB peptidase S55 domain-containing protein [Candidatus Brocadiales bacterium]